GAPPGAGDLVTAEVIPWGDVDRAKTAKAGYARNLLRLRRHPSQPVRRAVPRLVDQRRRDPANGGGDVMLSTIAFVRSIALGLALVLLSLAEPPAVGSQQTTAIPRVGVITNKVGYEALRKGLQDLAYTEGKNIILEFRSTEPPEVRLLDLVAEVVRLPVDVIVAGGTSAVLAARQATTTIPIVGLSVDPVASGLVATLARPGGNLTG